MSTLDTIAVIVIFLVIGYFLFCIIRFIKEVINNISDKSKKKFKPEEKPFSVSSPSSCTDKINKENLDNAEFKRLVEYFRPHYRWMTLAGGTEPMLTPQISFDSNGTIYLTKRGYDLWTGNWKDYMSASNPEDCKKSLEKFEQDLFGEYSGKLKISIEFIADHLIEFEDSTDYTSDFTLSFSFPGNFTAGNQKELFIQELRKTNIFML